MVFGNCRHWDGLFHSSIKFPRHKSVYCLWLWEFFRTQTPYFSMVLGSLQYSNAYVQCIFGEFSTEMRYSSLFGRLSIFKCLTSCSFGKLPTTMFKYSQLFGRNFSSKPLSSEIGRFAIPEPGPVQNEDAFARVQDPSGRPGKTLRVCANNEPPPK